jgi:hypothetical protein
MKNIEYALCAGAVMLVITLVVQWIDHDEYSPSAKEYHCILPGKR